MTGWYPHTRGHRTMYHMLRPDEPCLLKVLKDNGYFVWWGGKNDLVPGQNGYEAYGNVKYRAPKPVRRDSHSDRSWRGAPDGDNYYSFYRGKLDKGSDEIYYDSDWANVLGAIDLIRHAPTDQPLCIYLPLNFPHPPYAVEEPYYSMIDRQKVPARVPTPATWDGKPSLLRGIHQRQNLAGWTEDRWQELRATYYGMCARVDEQFRRVTGALCEAGLYDDTAVFFFSDHGDFTGDYGLVEKTQNTFEDCLSRVPFIVKPPRSRPVMPRVSDAMVELVDFSATVYDVTGIQPGYTSFGKSLLPVIAGERDEHRDAVFCEGGRLRGERHCMELDSTSSTNPTGLYWPRISWQIEEGPEHTKAIMCRTRDFKYVRRYYESDELYDLRADPFEQHNRVNDPALAATLAKLKDRLLTHYMETCDAVPHDTDKRT
jgi:arylsulfatase A-like enzyme